MGPLARRASRLALAAVCLLPVASATAATPRATIQRTAYGVPHILASDFTGLGYGYGYAIAQDNLCVLADAYMTVRAERSRYLGPDKTYRFRANSTTPNNLNSDFFYQQIKDAHTVEALLAKPPPDGPLPDVKQAVRGYVAGYNRYLAEKGADGISDPNCKGKPWVTPIEEMDVYRRFYGLALLASSGVAIDGIGSAQPPGPSLLGAPTARSPQDPSVLADLRKLGEGLHTIGSNAVGLGRDATRDGHGMVLGNPHFPWEGSERLYQAHLSIPGKLDVEGASLLGVPVVLIGNTRTLAWSHTVSTSYRFTPFELRLVPGAPTSYFYDGQIRKMTSRRVTVKALGAGGRLEDRTRTLYSSHQGQIFTSLLGLPLFPWTPTTAYAMGDANAQNFRYLNHFLDVDRAKTVHDLYRIQLETQAIPWVTTTAADSKGEVYFSDLGVVPNVPDSKAQACASPLGVVTVAALGLPVLDASRSACEWSRDADAIQPGTFGPSHQPHLFRTDYVTNSNDSAWLANPKSPLTGYARIIGDQRTPRSLRTRLGLNMVAERIAGTDGRPGKGFTLRDLQDMVFNNRQYAAELFGDKLIAYCKSHSVLAATGGGAVDVSAACPVLERWNRRDDLDSRGALLFRRFASRLLSVSGTGAVDSQISATVFERPFDADDAVHTPSGLNTNAPQVGTALADAVNDLRASKIPLDARLRDYQYRTVPGGLRIPIHGGPGGLGVFNAINVGFVKGKGYPEPPHGSSFVMAAHLTPGCPTSRMIVTYSQSTDPTSPHYSDMTRLFSRKVWPKVRFCERDVLADPALRITQLGGGAAKLRVSVSPRRLPAGRALRRLRVLVSFGTAKSRTPVGGAVVVLGGRRARTDRRGHATLAVRLARGSARIRVTRRALGRGFAVVSVR